MLASALGETRFGPEVLENIRLTLDILETKALKIRCAFLGRRLRRFDWPLSIGVLDVDGPLSLARSSSRSFHPNRQGPSYPGDPSRALIVIGFLKFPARAKRAASQGRGSGAQLSRFHTDGADGCASPLGSEESSGFEVGAGEMGRWAVLTIPLSFHSIPSLICRLLIAMLAARRRRRCHHADAQSFCIDYTSGSRSHANVFVRAEEDEEDEPQSAAPSPELRPT